MPYTKLYPYMHMFWKDTYVDTIYQIIPLYAYVLERHLCRCHIPNYTPICICFGKTPMQMPYTKLYPYMHMFWKDTYVDAIYQIIPLYAYVLERHLCKCHIPNYTPICICFGKTPMQMPYTKLYPYMHMFWKDTYVDAIYQIIPLYAYVLERHLCRYHIPNYTPTDLSLQSL